MSKETWFEERICDLIKEIHPDSHLFHVEAPDTPGHPDWNFCIEGKEGTIEFKWVGKRGCKVRPPQYNWARDRIRAGGNQWFIVGWEENANKIAVGILPATTVLYQMPKSRDEWLRITTRLGLLGAKETTQWLIKKVRKEV